MLTQATFPVGLPKAPRIPVCKRSAPAQERILLLQQARGRRAQKNELQNETASNERNRFAPDNVVRMQAHTQVEIIFADELSQVLVHDDACCFQSFAGNLFEFHSWVRKAGKLMVSLLVRFTRHDTRWTHRGKSSTAASFEEMR